jgi:hypothetical protein
MLKLIIDFGTLLICAEGEAPRNRQRPPVPAVIIRRSIPLWSTNQQLSLTEQIKKDQKRINLIFFYLILNFVTDYKII